MHTLTHAAAAFPDRKVGSMNSLWNGFHPARIAGIGLAIAALAAPAAWAETPLVIRDFVLAHDIQQREPAGAVDSFRAGDGNAVAFARIWNGGPPTTIRFVWRYGDMIRADVPVTVGTSPAWRTWSTVNLTTGTWHVALVDAGGAVLAERAFNVAPAPAPVELAPAAPAAAPQAPAPAPNSGAISFERAPDPFSQETPASATDVTQ